MSNLLNGGYTQLNDLIQVNADDIQTESMHQHKNIIYK